MFFHRLALSYLSALLLSSINADAMPVLQAILRRAIINHDAVVGFAEIAPDRVDGQLMLKYKPTLKVYNGCVPFPAVDAEGNSSGGLTTTGDPSGDCSSSTGQVYARAADYGGHLAIMYSWYLPKDSPSDGLGHRHDWENAIIWLSSNSSDATVMGASISAHGKYATSTDVKTYEGRPTIGYNSIWPVNHQLISTADVGATQPLIAWESMTDAAREAIETTGFGDATPSFRDSNFESYLADGLAGL